MKNIFQVNELGEIPSFSPPHHTKTIDKKLVFKETGARNLAIWYGEVEPGGGAEMHVHTEMEQVFYILEGEALFKLAEEEYSLGKGHLIFVPQHLPHQITAVGHTILKVLIIMAPPPYSMESWEKIEGINSRDDKEKGVNIERRDGFFFR